MPTIDAAHLDHGVCKSSVKSSLGSRKLVDEALGFRSREQSLIGREEALPLDYEFVVCVVEGCGRRVHGGASILDLVVDGANSFQGRRKRRAHGGVHVVARAEVVDPVLE